MEGLAMARVRGFGGDEKKKVLPPTSSWSEEEALPPSLHGQEKRAMPLTSP
jgi:hypothetical protein